MQKLLGLTVLLTLLPFTILSSSDQPKEQKIPFSSYLTQAPEPLQKTLILYITAELTKIPAKENSLEYARHEIVILQNAVCFANEFQTQTSDNKQATQKFIGSLNSFIKSAIAECALAY